MAANVKSLLSQTAVYGVSAILSKFINYLLTPYLSRVLTDSVFGEMSLLYAIIPFANVLLTMGMATAYFRWFNKAEGVAEKKKIFTTIWSGVSIFALLFLVLSTIFADGITNTMGYGKSWYWIATAILITIDCIAAIPLANLRAQGKAKMYTIINVTSVVINVVVCLAIYNLWTGQRDEAGWVVVANIVASGATLLMLLPSAIKLAGRCFSWVLFKKIASYSIPLMLAGLMGIGSDFLDRQMLRWLLPQDVALAQVGVYSAVAKIASLMIIFRQIYTLGAEPFFLQSFSKDDFKKLNAQALKYFTVVGLWVVMGIIFFADMFSLIIGESFRVGMDMVPIMLFTNLLMGVLVNLSFWYKIVDKTKYAFIVTSCGLATVIIASWLLIPIYGYHGAAYAHLCAACVMVILSYVLNQLNYKVDYDVKALAIYGALFVVCYYVNILAETHLAPTLSYIVKILLLLSFIIAVLTKENLTKNIKKIWKR